jgi:hypothetical protein
VALISIRPWSGLIDFERFTVFHTSTSGGGHDFHIHDNKVETYVKEGHSRIRNWEWGMRNEKENQKIGNPQSAIRNPK